MWDFMKTLRIEKVQHGVFHGQWLDTKGPEIVSYTPISGEPIASVRSAAEEVYEEVIGKAQEAFRFWRMVPPPKRGEIVRQVGTRLRQYKSTLSHLVTLETGKIIGEAEGEVQEMIDMPCLDPFFPQGKLFDVCGSGERHLLSHSPSWHYCISSIGLRF